MPDDHQSDWTIRSEASLRELLGTAEGLAVKKALSHVDKYCRQFIALSPFLTIGTQGAGGRADVSPRGDAPGFAQVLDDHTIAIPERPGNNRLDTLTNILANPNVGLFFVIPGFEDSLRINGTATLSRDPQLLARMAVNGRPARMAIVVKVEETFLHCAKAFKRSKLWDPATQVDRKVMPSLGRIILDQVAEAERRNMPDEATLRAVDADLEEDYRTQLW
jgi:PPOX class probable FMN-dependent enzyme